MGDQNITDLSPHRLRRQIREVAAALLRDEKVDLVIGYEEGSLPLRASPAFVRHPEEAERLIWDARCENNLVTYLRGRKERVGVVAKGCDARAIVVSLTERQLDRDSLVIIGVPCEGIIDRKKIESHLDNREVLEAALENGEVVLAGEGFEERLLISEYLCAACTTCAHRALPLQDVAIGEPLQEIEVLDPFEEARAFEARSGDERWAYFSQEFAKCIRCYACREACPLCYCSECFVDQTQPSWVGKTDDVADTMAFHLTRALHTAGRCVDCGACVRACPMGIDLRPLNQKMIKDVRDWYDYTAGLDLEIVPPLSTFAQDDPQEFIK